MVSVLAFYSDDPSSNTVEAYSFICSIVFEKKQNKQKEVRIVFKANNLLQLSNLPDYSFAITVNYSCPLQAVGPDLAKICHFGKKIKS